MNKPKLPTKPRVCLKCGKTFDSEGACNRICPRCNAINNAISMAPVIKTHG